MKLSDINKNIDSIRLEMTSEKSIVTISSLDESIESVFENDSPECKYITHFVIDACAVDEMGETIESIGFLKGTSIEAEIAFMDEYTFVELCDMISGDLYRMAVAITKKNGQVKKSICPPERNIMYIENLYVEEKYRGMGIGKYLLDNIGDLFLHTLNYSHHAFLLTPYPQVKCGEHDLRDMESATQDDIDRLVGFCKKAGYKYIKDSDYMYKIKADELFELLGI